MEEHLKKRRTRRTPTISLRCPTQPRRLPPTAPPHRLPATAPPHHLRATAPLRRIPVAARLAAAAPPFARRSRRAMLESPELAAPPTPSFPVRLLLRRGQLATPWAWRNNLRGLWAGRPSQSPVFLLLIKILYYNFPLCFLVSFASSGGVAQ